MRETGNIKCYNRERAFGFIRASDGREFFFHRTGVSAGDPEGLVPGAAVEFEIGFNKRSEQIRAVNVEVFSVPLDQWERGAQ